MERRENPATPAETPDNSCDDSRADCRAAGGGTTSTGAGTIAIVNCIAIPAPPGGSVAEVASDADVAANEVDVAEVASDADVAANEVNGATDVPADLANLIADPTVAHDAADAFLSYRGFNRSSVPILLGARTQPNATAV